MSTAELVHQPQELQPIFSAKQIQQRQLAIWNLMSDAMEKGIDYGKTPGCGDKNSLFKPGSEKILAMFQLGVDPQADELSSHLGDRFGEFRVRIFVTLKDALSGRFVGKGLGECSSFEEKYMWRRAVTDGEYDYMMAQNPDLVRIKFGRDYQTKKEYQIKQVRVPTADIANTVLKIAKKRAQIDATLTATAASAIFTQDLEDMPEEVAESLMENQEREVTERKKVQRKSEQKAVVKTEAKPESKAEPQDPDCINQEQIDALFKIAEKCKLSKEEVKAELQLKIKNKKGEPIQTSREIQKKDYVACLDLIDSGFKFHDKTVPEKDIAKESRPEF